MAARGREMEAREGNERAGGVRNTHWYLVFWGRRSTKICLAWRMLKRDVGVWCPRAEEFLDLRVGLCGNIRQSLCFLLFLLVWLIYSYLT